jgi:hypothetical protein
VIVSQTAAPLPIPSTKLREELCELVRGGVSVEVAAAATGVDLTTIDAWLARGESGGRGSGAFMGFRQAVMQARGEAEALLVGQIAKAAAEGEWRAAAWLLERGFDGRWQRGSNRTTKQPPGAGSPVGADVGIDPWAELDNVEPFKRGPRSSQPA